MAHTYSLHALKHQQAAAFRAVEKGQSLFITKAGRTIARIDPVARGKPPSWQELLRAVTKEAAGSRQPNPILEERQRRRR